MSKLSRSALKGIVKECLVEILQEGLETSGAVTLSESRRRLNSDRRSSMREKLPARSSTLDRISYGAPKEPKSKNSNFESNVKRITESMTKDPVLSSILADTARTTLQEQSGAESTGPNGSYVSTSAAGDSAARLAAASDPSEIFSESSDRWASLAFSENIPKV